MALLEPLLADLRPTDSIFEVPVLFTKDLGMSLDLCMPVLGYYSICLSTSLEYIFSLCLILPEYGSLISSVLMPLPLIFCPIAEPKGALLLPLAPYLIYRWFLALLAPRGELALPLSRLVDSLGFYCSCIRILGFYLLPCSISSSRMAFSLGLEPSRA